MAVRVSKHYRDRYRQRIARSKRIDFFANEAFEKGDDIEMIKDGGVCMALTVYKLRRGRRDR